MPDKRELERTELVIGLVAAVGTDIGMVADLIATELAEYEFNSDIFRLSDYLAELDNVEDFRSLPFDERVWAGMDVGDELRRTWKRSDALALWAISDIKATRDERSDRDIEADGKRYAAGLHRHAFILRSLKTQHEVETLRAVYGRHFVLVAAYTPDDEREEHLAEEIERSRKTKSRSKWAHQPEALIARDQEGEVAGGQQVGRTFHRADFFIDARDSKTAKKDVTRSFEILFGNPFRTPTRDEFGQFQAAGAAARSAELGRQVGAAIAQKDGSVISLGANEVPMFGGGSHWDEDGQGNREFEVTERDTNRQHQERIAEDLAEALLSDTAMSPEHGSDGDSSKAKITTLTEVLLDNGLRDITEFGRAVHAEMDALLDAARRGISVRDCTLYTTTFPCHTCARHIVAAGIRRVVFVEPYPKSKAEPLHEDSIAIAQSDPGERVDFQPFVGVAPRRYLQLFDVALRVQQGHLDRADGAGWRNEFIKKDARPVIDELEPEQLRPVLPAYRAKELIALRHFARLSEGNEAEVSLVEEREPQRKEPNGKQGRTSASDSPSKRGS